MTGAPTRPATAPAGPDYRVGGVSQGAQAVDRAAGLLSLVIHAPEPLTATELVEASGLARSTVSRLLMALERNGLLERDPEGAFRGGALFAHYATRFDRTEALVTVAQPYLERIAERTGETVNLGVPRGDSVVHAAQIDSRFVVGATSWMGIDVPPHCSALGKALYAAGALEVPDGDLERCTPRTVVDPDELQAELARARDVGFAVASEEFEEGLDAVAAPVLGAEDVAVAAIGVSGPTFRLEGQLDEVGALVLDQAERLGRALHKLG